MTELLPHLWFALGGGLGAVARHALTIAIVHRLPVATLIVNVLGCFVLGVALGLISVTAQPPDMELRQILFGFTGGFTTFSSFAYQTLDLHRGETLAHAAGYIFTSIIACLLALWLGHAAGATL